MTFVRFARSFEHKDPETGNRTRYPSGWAGELDGAVLEAATASGSLAVMPGAERGSDAPVDPGTTFAPNSGGQGDPSHKGLGVMTKAELEEEAVRRGVTLPDGATKAEIQALLGA